MDNGNMRNEQEKKPYEKAIKKYPAWNAKSEADKPIPSRFIEVDYEWNRTEHFKDWRSMPLDE